MYFRNKFDEEFLLLANNISPKGGEVRLDQENPLFFEIIRPPFDESERYVMVIPLLLYNHIYTTFSEATQDNETLIKDKIVEDWVALCVNRKDCVVTCEEINKYYSGQNTSVMCNMGLTNITGDMYTSDEVTDRLELTDDDYNYDKDGGWK